MGAQSPRLLHRNELSRQRNQLTERPGRAAKVPRNPERRHPAFGRGSPPARHRNTRVKEPIRRARIVRATPQRGKKGCRLRRVGGCRSTRLEHIDAPKATLSHGNELSSAGVLADLWAFECRNGHRLRRNKASVYGIFARHAGAKLRANEPVLSCETTYRRLPWSQKWANAPPLTARQARPNGCANCSV